MATAQELQQSVEQFAIDAAANGGTQANIDHVRQSMREAHQTLLVEAAIIEHQLRFRNHSICTTLRIQAKLR